MPSANAAGGRSPQALTDNDRSATRYATKERPEYARLRTVLAPGDVLVVWEPSRAGRSLDHDAGPAAASALERGVLLSYRGRLFDLNDGDDRFSTTGIDAVVGEKQAEDTRKQILRAESANLAAGRPHGKLLYGYRMHPRRPRQVTGPRTRPGTIPADPGGGSPRAGR